MKLYCPKCYSSRESIIRYGSFFRRSDSQIIKRFQCKKCLSHFSSASFSPCFQQNKRRINGLVKKTLSSNISQRRLALILGVSRVTVQRKLKFLGQQARIKHLQWLKNQTFTSIQFDDLETFEHSKCKPVTVTVCVNENRKIIGFGVASIPAKGHLAKISRKKYGFRKNHSFAMRDQLFCSLKPHVHELAEISSDEHPHYNQVIRKYFPEADYQRFKGVRGCVTGQGELKKVQFDPLFKINHTLAMLRANINRLIRRTWCTTKSLKALEDHLWIYVRYHNKVLT